MKQRMHEIKIRLNDEELARLNGMVEQTIFSREHFIRAMLAGYQLSERPQVEVPQLIMQVRHVGVTLNELLKRARLTGFVDAPELEKALAENRRAEETIFEAYLPERKQHGN